MPQTGTPIFRRSVIMMTTSYKNIPRRRRNSPNFAVRNSPFFPKMPRTADVPLSHRSPLVKYNTYFKDMFDDDMYNKKHRVQPHVLLPDSHVPLTSTHWAQAIHPSIQARTPGSLLYSKLRRNDEFILDSNHCPQMDLKTEDNHFVRNHNYFSHISINEMFPKGRSEYQGPPLPQELRQRQPLSDITRQGLASVAHRRYNVTSYMDHYLPYNYEETAIQTSSQQRAAEEDIPDDKATSNFAVKGLWPCWPAGNSTIISNITGNIVEKQDISSLDDARDYRKYKFGTKSSLKHDSDMPTSKDYKSGIASILGPDVIHVDNIDVCGCGPGSIGTANIDRDVPFSIYQQKHQREKTHPQYHAWTHERVYGNKWGEYFASKNSSEIDANKYEFNHLRNWTRLENYRGKTDYEIAMEQRWDAGTKMDRIEERTTRPLDGTVPSTTCQSPPVGVCENCEDLKVEDIEEEEDKLKDEKDDENINSKKLTFDEDKNIKTTAADKKEDLEIISQKHPYYCTTTNYLFPAKETGANDTHKLSLDLDRREETLSLLHQSSTGYKTSKRFLWGRTKTQRAQEVADKAAADLKQESYRIAHDPTSSFYNPDVKLPPHKLWSTLQYAGDRIPDRLGVRFKTTASKRYHAQHPEPVPDLRENHHCPRREMFLGYHSSFFR